MSNWNLQASAGAVGKSILWRGPWSSSASYNPYDGVSHGISSWISLSNNTNMPPSSDAGTNWQVMAQGGLGTVGPAGPQGPAATIAVGTTTTGVPGTNANVNNSGSSSAAVFNFTIPRGDVGAQGNIGPQGPIGNTGGQGPAATIAVGTTTTGAPGTSAAVANAGSSSAAVFNFTIPRGDVGATGSQGPIGNTGSQGSAATITAGTTTTGAAGTNANVSNVGTSSAAVFNFTIPRGDTGVTGASGSTGSQGPTGNAATITAGTTTTGAAGSSASVANSGTSSAAVFNFTIPRGDQGIQGIQGDPGPAGPAGSGSGDVTGPSSSVDNEVALYNSTTGKLLKRSTGTGYLKVTSGVLQTPAALTKTDVGLGNVDNLQQQPLDADLTAIAAIAPANDDIIQRKTGAWTNRTPAQFKTDLALTKSDVGLGSVDNTADSAKPVSTAQQTALNLKQDTSVKGVVNGYASLDSGGKVPTAQLPAVALMGGDVVGPGTSVANELAIYSDTTGRLIGRLTPPAGALVGTTGAQTLSGPKTLTSPVINSPTGLVKADVGLGNVDNTSDVNKPVSTAQQTAIDAKVAGVALTVDSEVMLFSGIGGKTAKRATGSGYLSVVNGVYQTPIVADSVGRMPRGHIWGLTLANNGTDAVNDLDIAAGEARNSTNLVDMILASALTKRLDAAWAVGTNQGGLDTGSIGNNTYHVHLIKRTDGTAVDALFSLSATAPTMPANYTFFRRIGSIMRVATGTTIRAFTQLGEEFLWKAPTIDVAVSNLGTTATSYTLAVPTGIQLLAKIFADMSCATTAITVYLSSLDVNDQAATVVYTLFNDFANGYGLSEMQIRTNTSGQIRARSEAASTFVDIITHGWYDDRGRNY